LNYRHAFHAGNFADLVKHAALLHLLARLRDEPGPLSVIDTHAGRGLYDLGGADAKKSGEAQDGILRLMADPDAPSAFAPLKAAVAALNKGGPTRRYPGSPWLIAEALGDADSYLACEFGPNEHSALRDAMRGRRNVRTLWADGYEAAAAQTQASGRTLVLIDPPFERPDDYQRIVATLAAVRRRNPRAVALVWLPLKDLETFDSFLRDFEEMVDVPALVAETRLKPLTDPMKMNGCALLLMNAPGELARPLEAVCGWTAATGGPVGAARVYTI
jgi:23S rRNA (adenine2030-N6)-methyltransferase